MHLGVEGGNYVECVLMAVNSSAVCPSDDFESCMSCHEICEGKECNFMY